MNTVEGAGRHEKIEGRGRGDEQGRNKVETESLSPFGYGGVPFGEVKMGGRDGTGKSIES